MNSIKNTIVGVVLISFFTCKSAYYQQGNSDLKKIANRTTTALQNIKEKAIAAEDISIEKTIDSLESKQKELFYLLDGCNERNALTLEYLNSLKEAQKMLEKIDQDYTAVAHKTAIIKAIYLDFEAKETSINSDENNDANTKVKVIVDSNEDQGYFVFGKLSFEQDLNIKRFRFNRPTQQASQDFVPGYYLFWLEKGELVGEPELHLIMLNGEDTEKTLVLKAPKK